MKPTSHRIRGANELDLHLLEWSTEGVPLVLLHGLGNEAHLWDDFVPSVTPHYRVLALDQRGHGDSDWDPEARYDTNSMTDDLETMIDTMGIDRFVLIGFSMGGRVAMTFAGRHPERLAGLVIVDIGPDLDPRGVMRIGNEMSEHREPVFSSTEEYLAMLGMNYPAGQPAALKRMAEFGLKKREDDLFELKMDPKLRGARPTNAAARANQEQSSQQQWDALAKVACATLVVRGAASDILSPETADKMVDEVLRNGRLATVPQAAHSVMTDNPKAFEEAVCEFVLG
jgi:pimeloyl-ACP methyl ester carboxylesterase